MTTDPGNTFVNCKWELARYKRPPVAIRVRDGAWEISPDAVARSFARVRAAYIGGQIGVEEFERRIELLLRMGA